MILSGQTTVAAAGTAVQLDATEKHWDIILRAHPDNAGDIFIGNDGSDDVTSSNGLALKNTDPPIRFYGQPSEVWVDAENNGDVVTWLFLVPQ